MNIEYVIVGWLLEKLKNEKLICETISDNAKRRFLKNLSGSTKKPELEGRAA